MTNRDIYESALRLLAQQVAEGENEDYEERAPYLIAAFCTEAEDTDLYLRQSLGLGACRAFQKVWLDLDETFPLCDRLAPVGCLYLAAMLVLDEDSELSDKLYDRYCDAISLIRSGLPASLESIEEVYFGSL